MRHRYDFVRPDSGFNDIAEAWREDIQEDTNSPGDTVAAATVDELPCLAQNARLHM